VREQLRKRLSEQEEKERATKSERVQKAASYLEQFYEVNSDATASLIRWCSSTRPTVTGFGSG